MLICNEAKHREAIRKLSQDHDALENVSFLDSKAFIKLLSKEALKTTESDVKIVRGYRVKVKYGNLNKRPKT